METNQQIEEETKMNTYEKLHALSQRMEANEIRHAFRNRTKRGANMDCIARVDLHCPSCDDSCRANCADTIQTFGAMHPDCPVEIYVISGGSLSGR